jgi:paraquat-inducible protein A
MIASEGSAAAAGLTSCISCSLVCRPADPAEPGFCPRCGERLQFRRRRSEQIAWSLLFAAAVCYIPANLLPVLTTYTLGSAEDDTIMQGVLILYNSGSWPLALIVLIASVVIPIGKIITLAYLLIRMRHGTSAQTHERSRLYHLVEFIGRWSMLDVFVDAYTVALVQLQPLMSVSPGPGVVFFAAVVVLTMLAVEYFDPRLIWDSAQGPEAVDAD